MGTFGKCISNKEGGSMSNPFTVTESAINQMVKICVKQRTEAVRFSIKGAGCAGFEYHWETHDKYVPEPMDEVLELGDDRKFVVDNMSVMYIAGAEIDYVEEVMSSMFKVNNPNASSSCGCGESVGF